MIKTIITISIIAVAMIIIILFMEYIIIMAITDRTYFISGFTIVIIRKYSWKGCFDEITAIFIIINIIINWGKKAIKLKYSHLHY